MPSNPHQATPLLNGLRVVFFAFLLGSPFAPFSPFATSAVAQGELLVFTRDTGSPVAKAFAEQMPEVEAIAEALGVAFRKVEVSEGNVFEGVTMTPSMVFEDHRGRSMYQGRWTTLERVRNFIQTSRFVHQEDALLERENVPVRSFGAVEVAMPIKVAPVSGHIPKGHEAEEFQKEIRKVIDGAFAKATVKDVGLRRGDRSFYLDFYPWVSTSGTLYLSYALFSQFHCKKAVYFSSDEEKLSGSWRWKRDGLFAEAARRLEAEIDKQIASPANGDGFDPIPADWKTTAWPDLPPALPSSPADVADLAVELGRRWVVAGEAVEEGDLPPVVFRFPAPLEQYSGQVTGVGGNFQLGPEMALAGATGVFTADPKTVRMGEPDLDDALQGSLFLKTKTFPTSQFRIKKAESEDKVAFGTLAAVVLEGEFTLRGKTVPLKVVADVEPRVNDAGQPRLLFRGSWILDFKEMDIEPADGPAPANHTLHFDTHILLKPDGG